MSNYIEDRLVTPRGLLNDANRIGGLTAYTSIAYTHCNITVAEISLTEVEIKLVVLAIFNL